MNQIKQWMTIFLYLIIISSISANNKTDFTYIGNWPYNAYKDTIANPGFGECPKAMGCECNQDNDCPDNASCKELMRGDYCVPNIGAKIPRFQAIDQFGEVFDLYDLAYQDKPILIEISVPKPRSCNVLSAWRSYVHEDIKKEKWWRDKFNIARDILDNDGVFWVQIMHLDEKKNPITPNTISQWVDKYPHDNIITLADPDAKMKNWVRPTGYPCVILLDQNMKVIVHSFRGMEEAFDGLLKYYDIEY